MEKEVALWLNKAKDDLRVAESNFKTKEIEAAAFFCQQAVEKALKGLYIHKIRRLAPKTHNLVFLSKELKLPEKYIKDAERLTNIYLETRYPDIGGELKLEKETVARFIKLSWEILEWCNKQL
ncbi:MAG TPA: HEPN domain-containing protein [Nanoarchaeota archaeon]|nr:HEPN domain-containing protein [Candidatus Pacearchaeota archaeon]HIH18302.1 HEPN domain-containing protein [Nanoarchaeota archaeon]HIH34172.1 HEPN domain-containing protein [Nanoarchaeota archaeon]HIH51252.1 HEPN domain-containing protein [Nanoarchaeota archaeon]HIH65779.1 HEPN domain-containing protein [Nanoarchaeota archaeon]